MAKLVLKQSVKAHGPLVQFLNTLHFLIFFFVFVNMRNYGSENFKRYSLSYLLGF